MASILEKVSVGAPDECWMWGGHTDRQGYGRIAIGGKLLRAHVLCWEAMTGRQWPADKIALHSCDEPGCVNPNHVRPGTHKENVREKIARGRDRGPTADNRNKTHCAHGHSFSGDNLSIAKSGQRRCRECRRTEALRYYYQRKAENAQPQA